MNSAYSSMTVPQAVVYSTVNHFPASSAPRQDDRVATGWQQGRFVDPRDNGVAPCVSVFARRADAVAFITSKANDLVARGDYVHATTYSHNPEPIPVGSMVRTGGSNSAPVMRPATRHVECSVHEIHLQRVRDGVSCFFRVTQHPVTPGTDR